MAPDLTVNKLIDPDAVPADVRERFARIDHRGSYLQMHFALEEPGVRGTLRGAQRSGDAVIIGLFCTPEELQRQWEECRQGIVPADPAIALQIPSVNDPGLAPPGKHAASAFALWFPIEERRRLRASEGRDGTAVIDKITRLAPNFEKSLILHTTFTPKHMGTMFGARRRLLPWAISPRSDGSQLAGADRLCRPGDTDRRVYLGSAGCHGGPGITFVPGYNAAKQALADRSG